MPFNFHKRGKLLRKSGKFSSQANNYIFIICLYQRQNQLINV